MKMIARHLTADLFSCQYNKLANRDALCQHVDSIVASTSLHLLKRDIIQVEDEHYVIFFAMQEGHCALHAYMAKRYVAFDVFLCTAEHASTNLLKGVRDYLKPEKFRTTSLKRGDVVTAKDVKPKVKTRIAPLRRTINTGAKVIRLLAQRKRQ